MPRNAGRRIAGTVAVLALLSIVLGFAVSWRDIQIRYHRACLRDDPRCMEKLATAHPESAARLALDEFLRTDEGRERLFAIYVENHQDILSRMATLTGYVAVDGGRFRIVDSSGIQVGYIPPTSRWIYFLLWRLVGVSFSSKQYPERVFKLFRDPEHEFPVLEIRLPAPDPRLDPMRLLYPSTPKREIRDTGTRFREF